MIRRPARLALLANLLLLPLALPATAAADSPDNPPPPADAVAGDAPAIPVANYLPVEPELTAPHPVTIDGAIESPDPSTVLVTFWAGPEQCTGVQRVDVEETPTEVRVGVFLGERAPGQVCTEIAVRSATAITLAQPIGDRTLVDAHAPTRPTVPADYAGATFAAWTARDSATLADLATEQVAGLLEARAASPDDGWLAAGCDGAAGSTGCRWDGADATLQLRVDNAAASAGEAHATKEARFATLEGAVAIWPLTTAEEAANTQAEVDAGSSPWMVDPATVARFFADAELGWGDVTVVPTGEAIYTVTNAVSGVSVQVSVAQPARVGPGGIWAVTQLTSAPLATRRGARHTTLIRRGTFP